MGLREFTSVPADPRQWGKWMRAQFITADSVAPNTITTGMIVDSAVTFGKFQDISALSVVGRPINSIGEVSAIAAGSDTTLLRRSGATIGFGTITSAYVSDFTEASQDITGALIQNGTGITWSYNDGAGTLTGTVSLASFSTTNLSEGANLYFTDERAQDAVGAMLTDSSTIDLTYTDATPSVTAAVIADSIGNTLLANMNADTIKGRASGAGTGDPTDLSAAQVATIISSAVASALNITAAASYTPTLTNVTNLDSSTANTSWYIRVRDMVFVFGFATVDPTALASTELGISIPIASNFGGSTDGIGVAHSQSVAGQGAGLIADGTNDRMRMIWTASNVGADNMFYVFMYRVI